MTVKDIYDYLNEIAPFDTAEEWDNCGLTIGSFEIEVKKIYIALDVSNDVLEAAKSLLNATVSLVDESVTRGIIHKNKAARKKSQFTKKFNAMV